MALLSLWEWNIVFQFGFNEIVQTIRRRSAQVLKPYRFVVKTLLVYLIPLLHSVTLHHAGIFTGIE